MVAICWHEEHASQVRKEKKEEERTPMARQPGSLSPFGLQNDCITSSNGCRRDLSRIV